MNCYDFSMKLAFVKHITYKLWTHYNETESERLDTLESDKAEYSTKDYSIIMCSADKKGHFTIHGYKEI